MNWVRKINWIKKINLHFRFCISIALCIVFAFCVKDTKANAKNKSASHMDNVEIHVEGANVKLKKGRADTVEIKYYGTASDAAYNLSAKMDGKRYKISLRYIEKGMAPTIREGGAVIQIPDKVSRLRINGKSAGIVLNNIDMDTDIVTKGCAVEINNKKSGGKIRMDSTGDAVDINSIPIKKDFSLIADGSAVKFIFTKQPSDLNFKLSGGYAQLPAGWSKSRLIGAGKPKMNIEIDGLFELAIRKNRAVCAFV